MLLDVGSWVEFDINMGITLRNLYKKSCNINLLIHVTSLLLNAFPCAQGCVLDPLSSTITSPSFSS